MKNPSRGSEFLAGIGHT